MFEGRIFEVVSGDAALDDGQSARRDVVVHPGGVAIVAELDDAILFVKQFRIATNSELLELPAGILEPGDTPETRAAIELQEETGYAAAQLTPLASFFVSPGYTTEMIHLFHATGLREVGRQLEEDERIELLLIPRATVRTMLDNGDFKDAKTIIGLHGLFSGT